MPALVSDSVHGRGGEATLVVNVNVHGPAAWSLTTAATGGALKEQKSCEGEVFLLSKSWMQCRAYRFFRRVAERETGALVAGLGAPLVAVGAGAAGSGT